MATELLLNIETTELLSDRYFLKGETIELLSKKFPREMPNIELYVEF